MHLEVNQKNSSEFCFGISMIFVCPVIHAYRDPYYMKIVKKRFRPVRHDRLDISQMGCGAIHF